jgi:hypothetical protein
MKLAELQHALRTADPAAVLVSPRVLDRLIQQVWDLPSLLWDVPHRKVFVVDRHVLFRHVEQDELDLEAERLLPPTVLLFSRPSSEKLTEERPELILLQYWRRLFHARVHVVLDQRTDKEPFGATEVALRIAELGRTQFEEVRRVLVQDRYVLARFDDVAVYREFAAVYLEMRYFAPYLLPIYFPGLRDLDRVDRLLGRDIDAAALFQQTRLTGAAEPSALAGHKMSEAHDYYWKLMEQAERSGRNGNLVRAAILRTRANRVAPVELAASTLLEAQSDLQKLMERVQDALQLSDLEVAEWLKYLPPLLDKADQGVNPVEAILLLDLQRICLEYEHEIYTLDIVEWLLSGGKRPIQRPMPLQKLVRVYRHLRNAEQRLALARLSEADRLHFGQLLQTALRHSEQRLRERCVPVLSNALEDVGLVPRNTPERLAFQKMIEEMLDRITAFGYLTFTDLRDTLSRNQLKMPDLAEPQDFIRGDALLCLDRRLGTALDGVYRRGTFYMRWLERLSALNFGTVTGRVITKYVTVPFGGAFILIEIAQKIAELFLGPNLSGPLVAAAGVGSGALYESAGGYEFSTSLTVALTLLVGLLLLAYMHVEVFRRRCHQATRLVTRTCRTVLVDFPLQVLPLAAIQRVLDGWPFQLFYWYVLKPAVACGLLWLLVPDVRGAFIHPVAVVFAFVASSLVLNSRFGQAVTETVTLTIYSFYELLRAGLIPGLIRWVAQLFKSVIESVEYVIYSVDEWLRFRGGESRQTMVALMLLGALWFPISYVARFYVVVLIEPCINPLKVPISAVAGKLLIPLMWALNLPELTAQQLSPFMPLFVARALAYSTLFLLPDAFGFFFWEMKENWGLFRANRPAVLRPVALGTHGETVRRLLEPGFHSGTLPKLYARLRAGEREATTTGNWRTVRTCRKELHEVERALRLFLDRELVTLLTQSVGWQQRRLFLGRITMATNRILAELHDGTTGPPFTLQFELCSGWLVASVLERGWLDDLLPPQRQALTSALAGLYKLSGAGLVREQIESALPGPDTSYEITWDGLTLFPERGREHALAYELRDAEGPVAPRRLRKQDAGGPVLDPRRLVFGQTPLYWSEWVECWQKEREGVFHVPMDMDVRLLVPAAQPARLAQADGLTASR